MSAGPKIPAMAATEERVPELRADAARNRARIVAAATKVFAERGLDASTSDIAREAGVGEATLFRRFPSKDDLILAIVQTQMDEVIAVAERCLSDEDPWRSVERFMTEMVERRVSDQAISDAAKDRCMLDAGLDRHRRRIIELLNELVERAQAAGVLRDDLNGTDLAMLLTAAGAVSETPFPGLRPDIWRRYLGVVLDGMRPECATKLRPAAPPRRAFERPRG